MACEDPFSDIRPYHDDEVPKVVARLLDNNDLLDAIVSYKFPRLKQYLKFILRPLVRFAIAREVRTVKDIASWQEVIAKYMRRMIARSIATLSYTGTEHLEQNKAYLFISNHRDIAMDPALVNWGLYTNNLDTVRIALGDNLLKKPYVSDIMRLNKSFIVKRSAIGMREKMKTYMDLSNYIDESVHGGHNIWIAQREGRAKDGVDASDPAVIKMLYMSKKKSGQSYADYIESLHIVPVSISYQLDPCDAAKAKELTALADDGRYNKEQYEDIESIVKGIVGYKGNVHVAFGKPLSVGLETPEDLVTWLDTTIASNYRIQDTNLAACAMQRGQNHPAIPLLETRMQELSDKQRKHFLAMYANPVLRQEEFKGDQ